MDYKKLIRSRSVRAQILRFLSFVPDEPMLQMQYWIKLGRKLNLKRPQRYTEKLQWYKINYRDPMMHKCVDKYRVREYVAGKGLEAILVKLYVHCDSIEEIQWETLPESFVMKTTHGAGGLNVIVCPDKNDLDFDEVKKKLAFKKSAVQVNTGGREWAYYGLKPGIIVEELLVDHENPAAGVNDYKIFCYSGKAKYVVVDVDRYTGHKRNFYDLEWNNLHITSDCPACDRELEKPRNFEQMLRIAEELAGDFPYVRVDLYNVEGKIYFGELTFYPWSGYVQYDPDEADFEFGKAFDLICY